MSVSYGGDSITFADGSVQSGGWTGFKNRIINGAMVIDQRQAGSNVAASSVSNGGYHTADRWAASTTQSSKHTLQQVADAPTGFKYSMKLTSVSAYTPISSDYFGVMQLIEGYNVADLDYGLSTAKATSLSFWVKSSITGTFGGAIFNSAGKSNPFSYTISSANTWTYVTINNIVGDTVTALSSTTNGVGLYVYFSFGAGSSFLSSTGTWQSGTLLGVTGQTNHIATNGATLQITGVQFEKGSTASSFEYRPYGTELALCQRYYIKWLANATNAGFGMGRGDGSSVPLCVITYPATMRASPTLTQSNTLINTPTSYTVSGISSSSLGTNSGIVAPQMATGTVTAGYACAWIANASTSYIDLSAEL